MGVISIKNNTDNDLIIDILDISDQSKNTSATIKRKSPGIFSTDYINGKKITINSPDKSFIKIYNLGSSSNKDNYLADNSLITVTYINGFYNTTITNNTNMVKDKPDLKPKKNIFLISSIIILILILIMFGIGFFIYKKKIKK